MGCRQNKSSYINSLGTALSMLSCGALEWSNNPYIQSIMEACASQNQKEILAMWVWLGIKSLKKAEAMEKSIHELKAEFVYYLSVCETQRKKINGFEITVTIFKTYKKCKSPIPRGF